MTSTDKGEAEVYLVEKVAFNSLAGKHLPRREAIVGSPRIFEEEGFTATRYVPESLLLDARAALNGERFQHGITKRELENAAESWVDDDGTVWDPPTAWAYAQVCRVEKEQRQRAERAETLAAELEKDARRYRFIRDSKANHLYVSLNDGHAPNYMTAANWIDENPDWFSDESLEEIQRMKDSDMIWCVQIYPDTPIGFYKWNAATLDTAIDAAIDARAAGSGEG